MSYQVLARTWRPKTFSQIVGQQHVVKALTNGLRHDRLHHAFLFTGTRGVGKTSVARILAKALNCDALMDGFDPCGECQVCEAIDQGRFIDLIEVDAASRTKVEDTRDLLDNVQYAPSQGRYKVYLIDEVHMLSAHSFNALLKTLEEPPQHVKFLLATTDPQKIPVTILSRCLQLNLKRLSIEQIQHQMQFILETESIEHSSEALGMLARAADGSMRDGLSLLDQAIVFGAQHVTTGSVQDMLGWIAQQPVLDLLQAIAKQDVAALLQIVADLHADSVDFYYVLEQLVERIHQLALIQFEAKLNDESHLDVLTQLANTISREDVQLFYQIALMGQRDLDLAPSPKAGMEMVLLRMVAFKPVGPGDQPTTKSTIKQTTGKTINTVSGDTPLQHHATTQAALNQTGGIPANSTVNNDDTDSSSDSIQQPITAPPPLSAPEVNEQSLEQSQYLRIKPDTAPSESQDNQNWDTLVSKLKLAGLSREFASHCSLHELTEKQCVLYLDPVYEHLQTKTAYTNLQDAIRARLNSDIKLTIKLNTHSQETPAEKRTRISDERQQAAQQAMEHDENVIALKQQFDAIIVPGSVEPMDETGEN